ncbi:DHHA1 domain-containing protein [uncultured Clostridium sp.]|uniref:alanyl-tRNA editing protein n=1 Tax=Clostridium disporicum TaxID=84024 RepID=UPI0025D08A54|nr:DHHA1 domain-containing protein [uncultured Clostridium sp.]MDU2289272.1 DHHA1 domain-containing protein [Clostridium celatum]MDU4327384.1 DHHA1 domain-containing protein [Clostridium celatum]
MEKLYYEDQYLKEFIAEVTEVIEKNNLYYVSLDKTAFFPGGGGQHCDLGYIDNHRVIDVIEENGKIYHVTEKRPIKIHRVNCKIDWDRRLDGMQQHLGQHVLSGCFFTLFNANTVSVHVGKDISTVDIQGYLDEETIRKAEKMANEIIQENIKVEFLTPSKKELKKLNLRRDLPNTDEQIRIVKIGDLDINACCGVHPSRTLDLQAIKVKRWEKHKGATRIEYLAGKRAINDYFNKDEFRNKICRFLNCGEDDAINAINNLSSDLKSALSENREIKAEIGEYQIKDMIKEAKSIGDMYVVSKIYNGGDLKYISKIAEKISLNDNMIVLFAVKFEDKANLIFSASKNISNVSMNDLLKDAITLIDGRGGGSKFMAQGGGKNCSNLKGAMDYALRKISLI